MREVRTPLYKRLLPCMPPSIRSGAVFLWVVYIMAGSLDLREYSRSRKGPPIAIHQAREFLSPCVTYTAIFFLE